ncbi:type II toxin-antitoxin system RelE/ParE family toxin [Bacillus massiliglaciei]|uniref:type II toxin-antitoxin system RelE/ParE family toxin n=1 Tax=Bacillus massiliglaciei TaxID=1816693 RepID=UPI000DA60F13|nr:type II toxin-antitoxin system RelE/ParE family toxin [Bacillus massiliglaciei]
MNISFKNKKVQKLCNDYKEMNKQLERQSAKKLQQRLLELHAAPTLEQISHLPPPRLHELYGDRTGQLAIDLHHPFRLVFEPDHSPIPRKDDGGLDRTLVTAIKILEVGVDYHGR